MVVLENFKIFVYFFKKKRKRFVNGVVDGDVVVGFRRRVRVYSTVVSAFGS